MNSLSHKVPNLHIFPPRDINSTNTVPIAILCLVLIRSYVNEHNKHLFACTLTSSRIQTLFLQERHNKLTLTSVMRTWRVNISMASLLLEGGSAASKASLQAPTPSPLPRLPFFSPFSHNAERGPRLILTLISTSWFGAISTELSRFPPIWLIKIKKKKIHQKITFNDLLLSLV